jgi:ATP-dependent Lhr-like helicase
VLSSLAQEPVDSVQALYISPLKALINDQFRRLEDLCAHAEIPVHRWHGDVSATDKARLRRSPGGVLLITPESLESQFVNYDRFLRRIYAGLRFVVIDELHAFLDSVRGIHLRSLLARLRIAVEVSPRMFGLSATLGDFGPVRSFLCPEAPETVKVIEDTDQQKELRVGLKAYIDVSEPGEGHGLESERAPGPIYSGAAGLSAIAQDVAQRFSEGSNLVFCNSRRQTELLADKLRQIAEQEHWRRNPFLLHHGSLSRDLREDTERELKSGHPVTAICTSTLEMGIDIGSIRAVGQVGPTWSVSSLVQRLGRSGRRDGEAQALRLYTIDDPLNRHSSLTQRLYPELIRAIALLELHRERWLEPPENDRFHFSTCVHQIFSICRQTGGTLAARLHDVLCQRGAFRKIEPGQFAALLRSLAAHDLIEQIPTGELILAPAGERIVESYEFYAAFASQIEFRVEYDGQQIGLLAQDCIPAVGEFLLFAGRRWRVDMIDHGSKLVAVTPAKGWKQPRFNGGIGGLHAAVMQRMRRILSEDSGYPYLNTTAMQLLAEARQTFACSGLLRGNLIAGPGVIEWYPWNGSRVLLTLELCAKADGIKTERDILCLRYREISPAEFATHKTKLAGGEFTLEQIVMLYTDLQRDRFDEYVPPALLQTACISEMLDLAGAQISASSEESIYRQADAANTHSAG